jgi:hypothetical protein
MGDVIRGADAPQGTIRGLFHELLPIRAELGAFAAQHGSIHVARANAVHANIVLAVVDRHRSR